jgi:hypothetical protein
MDEILAPAKLIADKPLLSAVAAVGHPGILG